MAKIRINKIDAARRQIVTAIELLFNHGDPVAIHTLVGAGWRILRDLCEKQETPQHRAFMTVIRPGMEKEFWGVMTSATNFFKHADRDADVILEVDETVNDTAIFLAIMYYVDLGNERSLEMTLFATWYQIMHPNMIMAPFREELRGIDPTDWPEEPRVEQLAMGRRLLDYKRRPHP